ncbi:Translocation protein [Nymphaea thermarum]|nr:Translocation protein [Nymphaea thermarum]
MAGGNGQKTKTAREKHPEKQKPVKGGQLEPNKKAASIQKQSKAKDVFQLFAEKVREHKKLESRWAVLQETRVEYFRGKDFVSFLKNHPEVKEVLGSEKNLDVESIGNTLLRKSLIVRCDRLIKIIRPGKKKLSTWPAHLEIFPDQVFSENDAFFAWTFVKRRPLWQTILSFLVPVVTLACCLFPVFPHWCKLLVLYFLVGFLLFICTMLFLRWLIFGVIWILLGKRVWFFPNILAEEATFSELFQFWPSKDEEERPKWTSRLTFAVGSVFIIWLARRHAPDEAARARYQKRVSNIIDDVLEWSPRLALSNMMEKQQPVFNATQSNHSTDGTSPDSEDDGTLKDVKVDFDSEVLKNDDQEDEETRTENV